MFNAPNKTHCLDKMTVEQFDREDKSNDKINAMIFIKSLKITITVSEKILTKYNSLGVKVKSIVADEQIKCLLFFKEHSTIIAGDQMGNIRVLRLKDLQEIKKKLPLNNGRYYLIIGKLIDTIIQLKGYRKRNDIFALAGDYKKIIIFDYDGNILKIIHEGIKNYIKKIEYSQSSNCLLYIGKHEEFQRDRIEGFALKIYDLDKENKSTNSLIIQKFYADVLFMKKINFLGMEMIITSTNEVKEIIEEDKFNYLRDNSIIIKSLSKNPEQIPEEIKEKKPKTVREQAEEARENYRKKHKPNLMNEEIAPEIKEKKPKTVREQAEETRANYRKKMNPIPKNSEESQEDQRENKKRTVREQALFARENYRRKMKQTEENENILKEISIQQVNDKNKKQKQDEIRFKEKSLYHTIKFFNLKSLVNDDYFPIFSFTPDVKDVDKITCAAVIKDLGNNYIALSGSKVNIVIYQILKNEENNYPLFREQKMLIINMKFDTSIYHNKLPVFCYLSSFDKFTLAVANDQEKSKARFNFFEYNES